MPKILPTASPPHSTSSPLFVAVFHGGGRRTEAALVCRRRRCTTTVTGQGQPGPWHGVYARLTDAIRAHAL
eukprot:9490184-Pyramimonas_sp.AAC.2